MGMTGSYAGILHSVKPQNICIAKKALTSDHEAMSNAIHRAEVGRRLRVAIEALGLTQVAVCRELGESTTKLGNWLRGDHYPDEWFVARFCDRYGITADWIYRGVVSGVASDVASELWKAEQASQVGK